MKATVTADGATTEADEALQHGQSERGQSGEGWPDGPEEDMGEDDPEIAQLQLPSKEAWGDQEVRQHPKGEIQES